MWSEGPGKRVLSHNHEFDSPEIPNVLRAKYLRHLSSLHISYFEPYRRHRLECFELVLVELDPNNSYWMKLSLNPDYLLKLAKNLSCNLVHMFQHFPRYKTTLLVNYENYKQVFDSLVTFVTSPCLFKTRNLLSFDNSTVFLTLEGSCLR